MELHLTVHQGRNLIPVPTGQPVSARTVFRWVRLGWLPAQQGKGGLLIPQSGLDHFLAHRWAKPASNGFGGQERGK